MRPDAVLSLLGELMDKALLARVQAPRPHWVGDGFHVRSLFSYAERTRENSPFLMLDHGEPAHFSPAQQARGVGAHPHRGIETVTLAYAGEVAHRDSTGGGGVIGPGDVQWMTAGGGILHEEFHSPAFTAAGGVMHMAQLWINLPAREKMTPAGYQAIAASEMPSFELPEGAGQMRVIGGRYGEVQGPARTRSPLLVADARLNAGRAWRWAVPEGWNALLVVLQGAVTVGQGDDACALGVSEHVVCARPGDGVSLQATRDSLVLLLSGEPLDEPVVGYGPFVMNSREEIMQAMQDFNDGKFGRM